MFFCFLDAKPNARVERLAHFNKVSCGNHCFLHAWSNQLVKCYFSSFKRHKMLGMKDKKKFWCVFRGTVRLPVMVDLSSCWQISCREAIFLWFKLKP